MEPLVLNILTAVGVLWVFMTFLFVVSVIIKRNDIADVAWGTGILLVGLVGYASHQVPDDVGGSGIALILLCLYTIWGVRLTFRIGKRNLAKSEEDYRYKQWRDTWGKWFYIRSYLQIYMLQGALMMVVGAPLLVVGFFDLGMYRLPETFLYAGLLVWLIGFFFEVVGDWQLDRFTKSKPQAGTILSSGLWKYSRHPNYFGEVTCWWGIWLMILPLPMSSIALMSPIAITFLILKVSGIPMLEKKFEGNPQFEEYKERTSAFFPLPPRS